MKNSKHKKSSRDLIFIVLAIFFLHSQESIAQDSLRVHSRRLTPTLALAGTAYVGGMTGLYFLWYKDYPQSSFHHINDNSAWLQIDKVGHAVTAYHLGKSSYSVFKWAGMPEKKALWLGGLAGFTFQSSVEVLDGFSSNWGFSWGDFTANLTGASFFIGQQILWHEQRISLKFSDFPSEYAKYNPAVLGSNFQERILKDYNGQTYWLSINIASFLKKEHKIPKWLNIAFGYGGKGMLNTYSNNLSSTTSIPFYNRTRQYYFSLDVDFSRIKTKSAFMRMLLDIASVIKFPFPALEFNKENGLVFHPIYF
jgi:uncharacterized protein YfiM (DUF2279 family)